ncbi:hypothetical protein CMI47_16340 [Candidatus Pacearchaeota archaeon]|nr:hypothetical protein [Candidatus Pacearchaeota archaeon]
MLAVLGAGPREAEGLDFSVDYPGTVRADEAFPVTITADTLDNYDVKMFVHDDTKAVSEIYDPFADLWKSSFSYVVGAYPTHDTINVMSHYIGFTDITVRMRETGQSGFDEFVGPISVVIPEPGPGIVLGVAGLGLIGGRRKSYFAGSHEFFAFVEAD